MNNWIGIGRLTKDPTLKFLDGSGIAVTTFTLAIDRDYGKGEDKKTDFINIVCWRELAEIVSNNCSKGRLVSVKGELQSRKYQTNEGHNVNVHEICADKVQFLDFPKDNSAQQADL